MSDVTLRPAEAVLPADTPISSPGKATGGTRPRVSPGLGPCTAQDRRMQLGPGLPRADAAPGGTVGGLMLASAGARGQRAKQAQA